MKTRSLLFATTICIASTGIGHAATQYFAWDAARTSWTGAFWGGGAAGPFTSGWSGYNEAMLGVVAPTVSGGTVSGGGAAVNKWTFNADGYILTGGFTMGSPLAANFIIPSADHTATISANLSAANGDNIVWKDGLGKLILSGSNTANKFVAEQGTLEMTGGSLTVNTASHTQAIKGFFIGRDSGTTTKTGNFLLSAGNLTVNGGNMTLGAASNGATKVAQFTQSGGTATINGSLIVANGGTSQVDLTGGTLTANSVSRLSGTGTLNFDGGTLKAGAASTTFLTGLTATNIKAGGAKIDTNAFNITIPQALLHDSVLAATPDGGLIKSGAGTLTFTGPNTYTGATTINAGTLAISGTGSIATTPVIDVATVATLQGGTFGTGQTVRGTGKLAGPLTLGSGSILSPAGDAATGTMEITGTLALGGTVRMQIQKSAGALSGDQFIGAGSIALGGTLEVTASGETLAPGDSIQLFAHTGGSTFNFASVSLPALPEGYAWNYGNLATTGTITVGNALSAPLFSPVGGGYLGARSVTVTADSGTTLFYTTDGSEPTAASPSTTSPLTGLPVPVDTSVTIKAFARKAGIADSPVATANYVTVSTARWNEDNNGLWSDASKWLSQVIPDAPGAPVDFYSFHQSGATSITLDSNRTAGSITFGNDEPINWTLNATNGSILTLAGPTTPSITVQPDIATTISAPIAGTQGLTKLGAGTLTLTGQNIFSGGATVNAGTLILQRFGTGAYISGPMVVNSGATLTFTNSTGGTLDGWGSTLTLHGGTANTTGSNAVWYGSLDMTGGTFNANCNFYGMNVTTHAAATTASITGGSASYNVNHTFAVEDGTAATDLSVSTPLGGTGTLTKNGAGTLTLAGANTYTGASAINAGTLLVTGSTHASSSLSVAASATLGGTGTVNGAVTAAGTLSPGTTGTGILATGAAALTGTYACQIDGASADRWNVSGNLNLTGATLAVSEITPASFTSVVIAKYTATLTGTFATTPSLPTGVTLQYDAAAKEIRLVTATDFGSWLAGFTFAPGGDTSPTGDPDGDGLSNRQEYAFGLNPTLGSSVNPITNALNKANATFTYVRRKPSLTGLNYKVWTSTNLATWTEDTGAQQTATDQGDNQSVLVTLSAPAPLAAQQLFIRCTAE